MPCLAIRWEDNRNILSFEIKFSRHLVSLIQSEGWKSGLSAPFGPIIDVSRFSSTAKPTLFTAPATHNLFVRFFVSKISTVCSLFPKPIRFSFPFPLLEMLRRPSGRKMMTTMNNKPNISNQCLVMALKRSLKKWTLPLRGQGRRIAHPSPQDNHQDDNPPIWSNAAHLRRRHFSKGRKELRPTRESTGKGERESIYIGRCYIRCTCTSSHYIESIEGSAKGGMDNDPNQDGTNNEYGIDK